MMTPAQAIVALGGPEAARALIAGGVEQDCTREQAEAMLALALAGLEAQQPAPSDAEIEAWRDVSERPMTAVEAAKWLREGVALMRRGRARDELRALIDAALSLGQNYGEEGLCESGFQRLRVVAKTWEELKAAAKAVQSKEYNDQR